MIDPANDEGDIPHGDDWQSAAAVAAWVDAADGKRAWRAEIRECIARHIAGLPPAARVLELGSGPGLLAECVLEHCPELASYTLLDFSTHMVSRSRERLARFPSARFVLGSFRSPDWVERVGGPFDCVVSMQAVHELRNKRHAPNLYRQIIQVTAKAGRILICDHVPFDDSAKNTVLYMTEEEQLRALSSAGFESPRTVLSLNGLLLYACEKAG